MKPLSKRFYIFALMMFFVFVADAIMSYYAPVLIEQTLQSSTLMGIVLASSSVVGIITDFLFAQFFSQKKAFFFQRVLFLLVFLFPLSLSLQPSIFTFILAMAGWGVSYEAMVFCTYHAIHEAVGKVHHAWAWGIVAVLRNIALAIGPLIASSTHQQSSLLPIYFAVVFNAVAVALFIFYTFVLKKSVNINDQMSLIPTRPSHRTFNQSIRIWKNLDKVIWPLLVLLVLFYLFESAVFSIGPLFSEHLKQQHAYGGLFVSLYGIPGIFVGFLVHTLAAKFGKKKVAFISGSLAGFLIFLMGYAHPIKYVLALMFMASFWFSMMQPALVAVFEDLVARGERFANDIISMTALTSSVSYVIGPVFNGFLNDQFSELMVFQSWGALIMIWSVWLLVTFPRKVRLPQRIINKIMAEN